MQAEKDISIKEGLEVGTYEIIKKRLQTQKEDLSSRLQQLNTARKEVFSSSSFALQANQRISTDNNGVARGIIAIGDLCIFGYNVHFGLRTEIQLNDVFSVFRFENNQFVPQSLDLINDPNFVTDYQNLYKYYRDSIFAKFRKTENYLYMIFQTSKNAQDLKAFKWLIKDGALQYLDDRSIHEVKNASQHEFEWVKTTLDDRRLGKYPHISILDKVFIEAINGDITFKIEDNTDTGKGIFSEKVSNSDQQLDDADYYYADLGNMIAVRIKPFQEEFRTFIFNLRTKEVVNIKSLNESAILLPDNQGLIFANGYYLQNGTYKIFDTNAERFQFLRKINAPNGEDFLYIFTQSETNTYILMSYNIIQQLVETPIICNGFTIFPDGQLIYFRTENEAVRHHQVQIWETPYSLTLQENKEKLDNAIYKIGNKDIVKAMAEGQEILQLISKEDSYEGLYEDILKKSNALLDSYFWIHDDELHNLGQAVQQIKEISNSAIDEFVKVQTQRQHADETLRNTTQLLEDFIRSVNGHKFDKLEDLVNQLAQGRRLLGTIIDQKNVKYIDLDQVNLLQEQTQEQVEELAEKTVQFLLQADALNTYEEQVEAEKVNVAAIEKVFDAKAIEASCLEISAQLELLIDILNSLKIDDATQTTQIIEKIAVIFSSLNEVKAQLIRKVSSLKSKEAVAEFSAQMTLIEQSVVNYLELSTTAEKIEDYYTKIVVQLEELESKFSEFDDFALQIADKRDDIIKAFNSKREQLIEQLNKRSTSLEQIGLRVLKNIENKANSFKTKEEILSFYAADLMIDKMRQLIDDLKTLQDVSKAENLENQLKKSQEDALRLLRDKTELYVDGTNIISLGQHKFSVNHQTLSLTLLRQNDTLYYHLTGTSFYQKVTDDEINAYSDIWGQEIISENSTVYRAEYLAYTAYLAKQKLGAAFDAAQYITGEVEQNYAAAYIKGVHNYDALQIFETLDQVDKELDLLRYTSTLRAKTQLFWHQLSTEEQEKLQALIRASQSIRVAFPESKRAAYVIDGISQQIQQWQTTLDLSGAVAQQMANYLFETLAKYKKFVRCDVAQELGQEFLRMLDNKKKKDVFQQDLHNPQFDAVDKFYLLQNWVQAFIEVQGNKETANLSTYVDEVAVSLLFPQDAYELLFGKAERLISGLKGHHALLDNGSFLFQYHRFTEKLALFVEENVPRFSAFSANKEKLSQAYAKQLKIQEFEPKVLSSFVRNRLINEVYFPLIGKNLAKQLGEAGENKRTARMGMLLLISPPGYGKTTLMEYLAKTMGLHFVKINGPTIGHSITSIDPIEAKTSGAREELKKINLSFEMADNVMLYLDDIQHLNPEFLQKFISLADGQRKMDGIFEGESKTYDLRGKRFCIVMSGNPYTESGSKFQIPDMLANRADVYNLGDVIGDTNYLFNLSLIENAASDNQYLDKIARKSYADFYALINYVESEAEQIPELEGNYLRQEIDDFTAVLRHVIYMRNIVVLVNKGYIQSAAMQDSYRQEPPFKMQGSYRNMSKLAAQVVPMMNTLEVQQILLTHYESESQTLTADTESNLLKLKETAGLITEVEKERWSAIKTIFQKNNKAAQEGNDEKVFHQLLQFNENLAGIIKAIKTNK